MGMPDGHKVLLDRNSRSYQAILSPEREGGFTVTVPELPGCITYGESIDHALSMAKEAIELYVETLVSKEGHPGPHHPIL